MQMYTLFRYNDLVRNYYQTWRKDNSDKIIICDDLMDLLRNTYKY